MTLGFYIHTCQKMRYKVDYAPSYLLDPQTYEWIPFKEVCQAILDDNPYAIFSQVTNTPTRPASRAKASNGNSKRLPPERADIGQSSAGSESESGSESEIDEADEPKALRRPPPPGFLDPENLPTPLISSIYGFDNGRIMPLPVRIQGIPLTRRNLTLVSADGTRLEVRRRNSAQTTRRHCSVRTARDRDVLVCVIAFHLWHINADP